MKVFAGIVCFCLGLLFIALLAYILHISSDYRGLWLALKIIYGGAVAMMAYYMFKFSLRFFKDWQFDRELDILAKNYQESEPGQLELDCSSQRLANEFWRLYKDTQNGRMYDRQKYDSENKKLRFKKR